MNLMWSEIQETHITIDNYPLLARGVSVQHSALGTVCSFSFDFGLFPCNVGSEKGPAMVDAVLIAKCII